MLNANGGAATVRLPLLPLLYLDYLADLLRRVRGHVFILQFPRQDVVRILFHGVPTITHVLAPPRLFLLRRVGRNVRFGVLNPGGGSGANPWGGVGWLLELT